MLILCKAWAPRRRLCDAQNEGGGFCFPASHLISIFVPGKTRFLKGHANFSRVFLKEEEMCGFSLKRAQTIKADFWQFTAVVAQGITVESECQAHATSAAFFTHSSCVCVCEAEKKSVFFWCVPWR